MNGITLVWFRTASGGIMDTLQFFEIVPSLKYSTYSSAVKFFQNKVTTISPIGKGDYGTVFRLSDGHVLKLFKTNDEAYKTFLKLVMLSDNPHLPNIYCFDEYNKFGWVILEFLNEYSLTEYLRLTFDTIVLQISNIICGKHYEKLLPLSLLELAEELKFHAKGYCLDFRKANFGLRQETLVLFDPFTNKTKQNSHLQYVEKDNE